jgi:hypothetical protein
VPFLTAMVCRAPGAIGARRICGLSLSRPAWSAGANTLTYITSGSAHLIERSATNSSFRSAGFITRRFIASAMNQHGGPSSDRPSARGSPTVD